ncbi:MAG: hypothetical protein HC904_16775 [Blastochloris sp.]|nr:hypothetical protein [Blastochloris sp.]
MSNPEALLVAAEDVAKVLRQHGVEAVVIGAVAMAAYHYVRQTEDVDLGVNASVTELRLITESLRAAGFQAVLTEADVENPLGGVIDVSGPFGQVQIINFAGRFPVVIDEAVRASTLVVSEGSSLRLVSIVHLIALKLYAGGYKSKSDIVELISRNPDINLEEVRQLGVKYGLAGIDEILREAS